MQGGAGRALCLVGFYPGDPQGLDVTALFLLAERVSDVLYMFAFAGHTKPEIMPGKLKALMEMEPGARTTVEYEGVMDDLVAFAGGHRLENAVGVPKLQRNADYYFDCTEFDCVMEFKQIRTYDTRRTVESFFAKMMREGRIIVPPGTAPGTKMTVDNSNMSASNWSYFYKKVRPSVVDQLCDADRQLRCTDAWLPRHRPSRIKAVFLLNSGDFNLPIDLLGRIVRKKVSKEWHGGHFTNLDYVMCGAFDMHRPGEHELRSHHLVRDYRPELEAFPCYLHDKWIRYTAAELGLQVEFTPDPTATTWPEPEYLEVVAPYKGKLRLRSG
jgi:hypothetical protein